VCKPELFAKCCWWAARPIPGAVVPSGVSQGIRCGRAVPAVEGPVGSCREDAGGAGLSLPALRNNPAQKGALSLHRSLGKATLGLLLSKRKSNRFSSFPINTE